MRFNVAKYWLCAVAVAQAIDRVIDRRFVELHVQLLQHKFTAYRHGVFVCRQSRSFGIYEIFELCQLG